MLGTKDGLERVSEVFLDNRFNLPHVIGDGSARRRQYLGLLCAAAKAQQPVQVGTYTDDIVYATHRARMARSMASRARIRSNGKIVKLKAPFANEARSPSAPRHRAGKRCRDPVGRRGAGTCSISISARTRLFVRDIVGGPNQVRIFDLDGKPQGKLPLPEIAANSEIEPLANGDVLFDVSTYLRPRYYARWHPATGKSHRNRAESDVAGHLR